MATWVLTDETCNINYAENGVSHRTLPKELTVLEIVLAGEALNDTSVDCVFVRYEGKYAIELPYNDTAIGVQTYASAELLRQAILALINNNPCAGGGGAGVDEFSELIDAYDLATAPAFSVPINNSGTLIPANIYETTPIIVDAATTAALAGTWNYANGAAGVGATLTRTTNGAFETQDGVTAALNRKYLIKNWTGANRLRNGVYLLSTVGSAGTAAVLTRATDSDTQAELDGQIVLVSAGTTNRGTSWRQVTSLPTVGTSIIVYQTNAVAAPSVAPTPITVAAAQALVTAGTVVVGRWYSITDSSQAVNANDRIWVRGATPDSFDQNGMYIDTVNSQRNFVIYKLDDGPSDLIVFRMDLYGNQIFDLTGASIFAFPWGNSAIRENVSRGASLSIDPTCTFYNNICEDGATVTTVGTCVVISNKVRAAGILDVNGNAAEAYGNEVNIGASLTVTGQTYGSTLLNNATVVDAGFGLSGILVMATQSFTATANMSNAIISGTTINSTAGDSATINAMAGRFRKDTSGTSFTLTNSYILSSDSVVVVSMLGDPGNASAHNYHLVVTPGQLVINFESVPNNNVDFNFLVFN